MSRRFSARSHAGSHPNIKLFDPLPPAEAALATLGGTLQLTIEPQGLFQPRVQAKPRLVKQLPPETDDLYVYDLFRPFGPLASVKCIVTNPITGEFTGFRGMARVDFYNEAHAVAAESALYCQMIGTKSISVALLPSSRNAAPMQQPKFSPKAPTFVPKSVQSPAESQAGSTEAKTILIKRAAPPSGSAASIYADPQPTDSAKPASISALAQPLPNGTSTAGSIHAQPQASRTSSGGTVKARPHAVKITAPPAESAQPAVPEPQSNAATRDGKSKPDSAQTASSLEQERPKSATKSLASSDGDSWVKDLTQSLPSTPLPAQPATSAASATPELLASTSANGTATAKPKEAEVGSKIDRAPLASPAEPVNGSTAVPVSTKERQRLCEAVKRLSPLLGQSDIDDITDLLSGLSKKERATCLFNQGYLQSKVDEAKEALDLTDTTDIAASASLTNDKADDSGIAHQLPDLSNGSQATSMSPSTSFHTLSSLAHMSCKDVVTQVEKAQRGKGESGLPLQKIDAAAWAESERRLNTILAEPKEVDRKQKLGQLLFKQVKASGVVKGGNVAKVTIALLDQEDLRSLGHVMESFPDLLKQKIEIVQNTIATLKDM